MIPLPVPFRDDICTTLWVTRTGTARRLPGMSRYFRSTHTAKGRFLTVVAVLMVAVLAAFVLAYVQ
jgi:hypothetical protein